MDKHLETDIQSWDVLGALIGERDVDKLGQFLNSMSPSETARTVSRLNERNRLKLLMLLNPEDAVDLLKDLPDEQAANLMGNIPVEEAKAIVDEMPPDEQADILADMETQEAEAILDKMSPEDAERAREILQYPEDSAGGIMETEFLAYRESMSAGEVLSDLQEHGDKYLDHYYVQYAYIISTDGKLSGVLRMRDLIMASKVKRVGTLIISDPLKVRVDASLDEMIQLFEKRNFIGIPVVDNEEKLVGVVRRDKVLEASGERGKDVYLKASGIVGGDELRSMPILQRSRRRLSWLSVNIILNVIAASVIAIYQDTLSAVIALAVFLPIISDMSGCSGNQAVAVSIRELTLGLVKPFELFRVLSKEMWIGVINGIVLGILLGAVAFLWKRNPYLGLVVGGALAINTLLAVCLGGMIPLFLQRIGKDPALASSPLLTTVTDMCGFFFALAFATAMLPLIS